MRTGAVGVHGAAREPGAFGCFFGILLAPDTLKVDVLFPIL